MVEFIKNLVKMTQKTSDRTLYVIYNVRSRISMDEDKKLYSLIEVY